MIERSPMQQKKTRTNNRPLQIGYVPMTDCAPLVIAQELGYFSKHGLDVELCREPGWATIREKIYHRELDAAQAPGSMVFELSWGYGGMYCQCITAFVTALNGNAITLSNELWEMGVRDGKTLRQVIQDNPSRRFTFAGVLKYSSQNYLMRHWLMSHGIDPDRDVDMVIVAPPQVHDCLKHGYLDGYCVAEPWSSIGLLQGIGWCTTLSSDFSPMHLEKVFMVTEAFHNEDPDRHISLLLALSEAARYCDAPENRSELSQILSAEQFVGVSAKTLNNALVGPFQMGMGRSTPADQAIVFYDNDANRPTAAKARWVLDEIGLHQLQPAARDFSTNDIQKCFREDIYESVLAAASA
jgi:ABC-type nitrate/sulfonate/bicarbonate transport system substrate-binding protein